MKKTIGYLIFIFFISWPSLSIGQPPIIGQATVIDGDTIRIDNIKIRLLGIDAPDKGKDPQSVFYVPAQEVLANFIGQKKITCRPTGDKSYDRIVAICFLGKIDLSAHMVEQGYAVDWYNYSKGAYADEMMIAKQKKLGIWKVIKKSWR